MNARTVCAALLVVVFGWGSAWMLSIGAHQAWSVAFERPVPASGRTAAVADIPTPVPDAARAPATASLSILIGGDVMFDRAVRKIGQRSGYDGFLAGVAPLFKSADIAVVNLEGPITSSSSKTLLLNGHTTDDLNFTFAPETAHALAEAGVRLVSLANNHTDNFGMTGFEETKRWLSQAGLGYFGDPWNDQGTEKVVTEKGITVAFVGYHGLQPGFERVVSEVKRLSDAGDFVVVMPHWGVEYSSHSTAKQKAEARRLAEAGAGAVIGAHPHVVLDHEWIGPVPVYYSLGNLLFDQYDSPRTTHGNIVGFKLSKGVDGATRLEDLRAYETSIGPGNAVSVDF